MPLVLNEDQNMLKDSAKRFCADNTPITQLRRLRDENDSLGFDKETWNQMVDLGWSGITVPEAYGGSAFGYMGLGVVMEECGRTLAASPLFATAALGTSGLIYGGSEEMKAALLGQVAEGKLLLALALEETAHHSPYKIKSIVEKVSSGYEISGTKNFVLDGHVADKLIVVGRSFGKEGEAEGLTLLLVDRETEGVAVTRTKMADSRNAANVSFNLSLIHI